MDNLFGVRLKTLRAERNMTQKKFAEFVGITPVTLSAYENGNKNPSLENVKTIATSCEVTVDWLCGLSDERISTDFLYYSDIIRILLKIDKKTSLSLTYAGSDLENSSEYYFSFNSDKMRNYIKNYYKYTVLYKGNMIDDDIYNACIEKLLRDSHIAIDGSDINSAAESPAPSDQDK